MAKLIDQLIPARFLLTIGHFIALMMVIYTREENIYAAYDNNPSSSVMDGDKRTMNDAIIVGAVCLGCDMWGLFQSSLFMNKVNMLQIIFHFMGGVAVSTFIQNQWPYPYLWVLVALFNVPTALVEFSIIMAVNCFGIVII